MSSLMENYARFPLSFIKGDGAWLYADNGEKYLDFGSGISVTNLGHNHKSINEAICNQVNTLIHTSNLFLSPLQEELSKLITDNSFDGKVFFCNSGAEANEGAIKLARLYGNKKYNGDRYKILSMYNSFHGRTYATLSATAQHKVQAGFTPIAPYNIYAPYNDIEALKQITTFGDVVAIILELFQGEGGVIPADKQYIKDLRSYCSDNDILLIVDEVQTGYGRTGKFFAHKLYDIEPDIMTLAKAMANGIPMGAFVAKNRIAEYMTVGTHGSTFGGNNVACIAAIKVIEELTKENFLENVVRKGNLLKDIIKSSLKDSCTIRGEGLLIGIETKFESKKLFESCIKHNLVVITAGNNSVRLYPPLNISDEELRDGANRFIKAVKYLEDNEK